MIIVNKNGASLSNALVDPSKGADTNSSNGPAFEHALQSITDPISAQIFGSQDQKIVNNALQVKSTKLNLDAALPGDFQNTLTQEKLIQDQLAMSSMPAFQVTGPDDVSTGNNDPVAAIPPSKSNSSASKNTDLDPVLKNIIAWRQEQIDPLMQVRVGDTWAKQGIEDPFNEPHLISQAQEILETAQRRLAMNPGTKAPWDGDWQSALVKDRAAEAQRIAVLADGAAHSNFLTGGKG
jgi:hypothetical protein